MFSIQQLTRYLADELRGDWRIMIQGETVPPEGCIVVAATHRGRVSLCPKGIYVEAIGMNRFSGLANWRAVFATKVQARYTKICRGTSERKTNLQKALDAIGVGMNDTLVNADAPEWTRSLISLLPKARNVWIAGLAEPVPAGVLVPQNVITNPAAITVLVIHRWNERYQTVEEHELGRYAPAALADHLALRGVVELRREGNFVIVGTRETVTKMVKRVERVSRLDEYFEGKRTLNDIKAEFPGPCAFTIALNGNTRAECRELRLGDVVEVVLDNPDKIVDATKWFQRQAELKLLSWNGLRVTGRRAGIKVVGNGRTSAAIIRDIMHFEFPNIPDLA